MADRHDKKRATMAANIEVATGRTVDDWVTVVDWAGIEGFTAVVTWLKTEHGFGHFQARLVAEQHRDRPAP